MGIAAPWRWIRVWRSPARIRPPPSRLRFASPSLPYPNGALWNPRLLIWFFSCFFSFCSRNNVEGRAERSAWSFIHRTPGGWALEQWHRLSGLHLGPRIALMWRHKATNRVGLHLSVAVDIAAGDWSCCGGVMNLLEGVWHTRFVIKL